MTLLSVITPPAPAIPEFLRVAAVLRSRIRERFYTAGQRLPAAPALAEELDSNRSAVERAVRMLSAEGLLTTKQGSGAYAPHIVDKLLWEGTTRHRPAGADGTRAQDSFGAQLRARGLAPREITNDRGEIPPADVAAALAVDADKELRVHEVFAYAAATATAPDDLGTPIRITRT